MNPFVSKQPRQDDEVILDQRRLHKGIFILPAIVFVVAILGELLTVRMFQQLFGAFDQLGARWQTPTLFYVVLVLVGMLPAGLLLFVTTSAYLWSEFTLTNYRLRYRTGLLLRTSGEIPLENIEAIYISEGLLGQIMGYGSVTVTTVGGAKFPLEYLANPHQLHLTIQKAVADAKSPRRSASHQQPPSPVTEDHSRYMPKT